MIKRLPTLILTLLLTINAAYSHAAVAGIDDHTAIPGTQVVIPVWVSGFSNVGALTITIVYNNEVLDFVSYQNTANGQLAANAYILYGYPVVTVNGSWVFGTNIPDGVLIEYVFNYLGGACNLEFFIEECDVIDPDFEPLSIVYVNGSIAPESWQWMGTLSAGWNTPGNWNLNAIPDTGSDVWIDAASSPLYFPEISAVAEAATIHLAGNISLTINPAGSLTADAVINQSTHSSGGIVLRSDATGTGSLLHYNSGVNASVERYVGNPAFAWHLLSSPVGSQNIADVFSGNTFFTFYEPANAWVSFQNSVVWPTWQDANQTSASLIAGKGYLASFDGPGTKVFSGTLNQGDVHFALSHQAHPADNPGYNLMGNPYPSAIDWKAANGWSGRENLQPDAGGYTIWIWNHEAGNYGAYNSALAGDAGTLGVTRYIAPMQGFFVKAASDAGIIGVNDQARVHSSQAWIKNNESKRLELLLQATGGKNTYSDMVLIEASITQNGGGAAKMFSMIGEAPGLYIADGTEAYSIYYLNYLDLPAAIALGMRAGTNVLHTLSALGTEYFSYLVLEDLQNNTFHDLKQNNTFHFSAAPGDLTGRFLLHLKEASHTEYIGPSAPGIFYYQGYLVLENNSGNATIDIFDAAGKQVNRFTANQPGMHRWRPDQDKGIYIFRLTTGESTSNGKILHF